MFGTDAQTQVDLGICGRGGEGICGLYNHTHTRGGAAVLEEWFRYPLSDADKINTRSSLIRHFAENTTPFPFDSSLRDAAEQYLSNTDERTRL